MTIKSQIHQITYTSHGRGFVQKNDTGGVFNQLQYISFIHLYSMKVDNYGLKIDRYTVFMPNMRSFKADIGRLKLIKQLLTGKKVEIRSTSAELVRVKTIRFMKSVVYDQSVLQSL